jgi:hypothetical protein
VKSSYTKALLIVLIIFGYSCKVPYMPPVVSSPNNYLVVEGIINAGNTIADSTIIKLSRTAKLAANTTTNAELRAQVSVEDGQSFSATLKDAGKGNYVAGPLGLDNTKKYRLRIKTSDGKVYLSDLVAYVYTPPVDSIGFTATSNQVTIYANTHNPANNTRNYRWDFSETWEIQSPLQSFYMSNGKMIVDRDAANQYPVRCWQSDVSTGIILGSSSKLVTDVIYQQPITYIPGSSEKVSVRYSIFLKQYGLSDDAFKFWQQIQKNTESLGSIFDAQPSQINGNIHCTTDAAEPVFGYISITNIQTKRVYINRGSLPGYFASTGLAGCSFLDSIYYINPNVLGGGPPNVASELIPVPGAASIPVSAIYKNSPVPVGFVSTKPACVDCSFRGSKTAPSFWKEQ